MTRSGRSAPARSPQGTTSPQPRSDSNVAVIDSNYAQAQEPQGRIEHYGRREDVQRHRHRPSPRRARAPPTSYIPLARAQTLANMPGEVNTIYVSAASAADISGVSGEISRALPTVTVTTSSNLASEVTGSLSSASTLANSLGKWLAVAVLAAAFGPGQASSRCPRFSRRVREFGTLKAMGWRSRRIIRQIMGEALVIGIAGGAAGRGHRLRRRGPG